MVARKWVQCSERLATCLKDCMSVSNSKRKIDAIYDLRAAAERKALAEKAVDERPTRDREYALLEAKATLENKTVAAIAVCHECGHDHPSDAPHGNVVDLDERREAEG
jgi:hypothetical protein